MNCENIFCIYQSKGKCMVERIEVDCTGTCATCLYPGIDEEILEKAKVDILEKLDRQLEEL